VPAERQSALFSATMPPRIADLARRYMRDPQRISVTGKQMTVTLTEQMFYEVPRARKVDALTRILDAETPTSTMIFCRTKIGVDELGESLLARGYTVETLHGDLSQAQRDRVMRRFRSGQADILIATDVAARGLDIPEVSHVINFDAPESAEAYVHRIGRTGRAGRTGAAITLVTPREVRWLRQIERITKAKIEGKRLPTIADVAERRREMLKQRVLDILSNPEEYQQYVDTIDDLAEERDAVDVAAAVLKLYADETGRGTPEQQEDDIATFSAATAPRARGEAGMVRLFLNAGRNQGVRPQDVVGAIANEAGIPGRAIGAIDILDTYTFVDIPNEFVNKVLAGMQNSSIKGRRVNIEIAKPAEAGGPAGSGGRSRGGRRDDRPRDDRRGGQSRGGGAQGPYVGGVRVTREGDEQRPPGNRDRGDQGGGNRRYDRTGPARFRVRRDD
jgi:ATP-dependent RNA helicase DeaD